MSLFWYVLALLFCLCLCTHQLRRMNGGVANSFQDKWWFPYCLCAIDGKHITIITLRNYKSHFSVVLIAVVDAHYRFLPFSSECPMEVFMITLIWNKQWNIQHPKCSTSPKFTRHRRCHAFHAGCRWGFSSSHTSWSHTPSDISTMSSASLLQTVESYWKRCVVENLFDRLANRWWVFLTTNYLNPKAVFWPKLHHAKSLDCTVFHILESIML